MTTPQDSGSSLGSTASSLLRRVQSHDQDAWRRLVRLYGPLVASWLRRAGLQSADVEDVFQFVFKAVAASIGTFQRERTGGFRRWLRTITMTKLADHFRRRLAEPEATGGSDAQQRLVELEATLPDDTDDELNEIEALRRRALQMVRSEFEEKTWQAFWRRHRRWT